MSDRRARAACNADTWMEFRAEVRARDVTSGVCGLCGNSGVLRMSGLRTPAGYPVPAVEGHCICPNGRVTKRAADRAAKTKKE